MSLRKFNPNSIADQDNALRWETARADLLLKLGHLQRAAEVSMKAQGEAKGAVVRTVLQSADRTQMKVLYGALSAEERAAAQAELDGAEAV